MEILIELAARGFERLKLGDDDAAALADSALLRGDVFALDVDGA